MAVPPGEVRLVGKLLVKLHVELQGLCERIGVASKVVGAIGISCFIGKRIKIQYLLPDRILKLLIDLIAGKGSTHAVARRPGED